MEFEAWGGKENDQGETDQLMNILERVEGCGGAITIHDLTMRLQQLTSCIVVHGLHGSQLVLFIVIIHVRA
jgi:hypothetical protein